MMLHITLIVVAALFAGAIARFLFWLKFWQTQGRRLQKSGYLPPPPSICARLAFRLANRFIVWLTIGPCKVIGRENLRGYKGRLLVAANHIQPPDWALVFQGFHYERYTAASYELKGIRGLFSAWTGCFGVNTKQEGGGEAFRQSCETVLAARYGASLLVFPQGKLVADNILRKEEFRFGAVRMLKGVSAQICDDVPVAILPEAILYKTDIKQATCFHRIMLCLGQKWFRNIFGTGNVGAVVVVGKPILLSEFPADEDPEHPVNATEFLRLRIQELLDVAQRN